MYADYDYYEKQFLGKVIRDNEEFKRQERKARRLVDKLTRNRCTDLPEQQLEVKDAVCAAAEVYYKFSGKENVRGIKSENNDGFQTTYSEAAADPAFIDASAAKWARFYLEGTGLLLRRRGRIDDKR